MHRNKWKKASCTLHWTVHRIDLKNKVSGDFELQWARGGSKGQTDKVKCDDLNQLVFESKFEIKCTIYIGKSDGNIRAKLLKIALKRYRSEKNSKVYGKLTLDVSKYFGKGEVAEEIEMESGRSTAPIMKTTLSFVQDTEIVDAGNIDEKDISFAGETQDKMKTALDEWDVTEYVAVEKEKHRHKHKDKNRRGKVKEEIDIDEASDEGKHRKSKKKKSKHAEGTSRHKHKRSKSNSNDQEKEAESENEEKNITVPEENDASVSNNEEYEKDDEKEKVGEQSQNEESEKIDEKDEVDEEIQNQENEEENNVSDKIETPSSKEINYYEIIKKVLSKTWALPDPATYIDENEEIPFPPPVFPFFSVLLYSNAFSENSDHNIIDFFFENYSHALFFDHCTNRDRLLVDLILLFLAKKQNNSSYFIEKMNGFVEKSINSFLTPILQKFDVLINRFSTAKFEMDPLLNDFKHVFNGVKYHFTFTKGINQLLTITFLAKLDYKISIKLIANPSRFLCSNAILWNSFISAFTSDERIELKIIRQFVSVFIMVQGLSQDPSIREEIADSIPPEIILFIMKNYHPDILLPDPIETVKFASKYKLRSVNQVPEFSVPPIIGIENAEEQANISGWNKGGIRDEDINEFPWLAQFKE